MNFIFRYLKYLNKMTVHSKVERILYIPGAGISINFLHVKEFLQYSKIVLIDQLPNAKSWSMVQNDLWKGIYEENDTLDKFISTLITRFGTNYKHYVDKKMLRFKYYDGRILEYYYDNDAMMFEYEEHPSYGILFDKIRCVLYEDDEDYILDIAYTNQAYLMKCDCENADCSNTGVEMREIFDDYNIDYIPVVNDYWD